MRKLPESIRIMIFLIASAAMLLLSERLLSLIPQKQRNSPHLTAPPAPRRPPVARASPAHFALSPAVAIFKLFCCGNII